MPSRRDEGHTDQLLHELAASQEPLPLLEALTRLWGDAQEEQREEITRGVLACLQRLIDGGRASELESIMAALGRSVPPQSASAQFVANLVETVERVMEPVYDRVLRSVTQSYLTDGSVARCPRCGSQDVQEGFGMYEFSEMTCAQCGLHAFLDDYELEEWYPS